MKQIKIQEIISFLMVVALIVLTFMYPTEFKERFGQVLSAILGAFFVSYEKSKK